MREKNATNPNLNRSSDSVPFINRRIILSDSDSDTSFVHMTISRLADQFSKDIVHHFKKRCKSDGMLYESHILSTVNKRFSSSPASDYSPKAIANRTAIGWTNRLVNTKNNNQAKAKRLKNRSLCPTVENLKLNFESKDSAKEPKRGKSLPSSPIASIYANNSVTAEPTASLKMNYDKLGCEEISVKGLVDKYEVTKLKNEPVNAIPATTAMTTAMTTTTTTTIAPATSARFKRHTIHQSPQHNAIHPKPPPIPHASKSPNNILLAKPVQQNSQSFARLKEHFNSASAYNTM